MNTFPHFLTATATVDDGRPARQPSTAARTWRGKAAAFRATLLVFALTGGLVGAGVYTLDRNAQHSTAAQAATALTAGSHVAASSFSALRANQRAHAGQIAASLDLQQAVITRNKAALRRIAASRQARITVGGASYGTLPPSPRLVSTAIIASDGRVLARIAIGVSLGNPLLRLIRDATPLPPAAALMIVQRGRVVAGGPRGARARIRDGRVRFGKIDFMAEGAALGLHGTRIVAVEPARAVAATELPYRRRLLLAGLLALVMAGAFATRLGRPVARLLNDVTRLTRQAQTDALTGLANRRTLDERLAEELDRARERKAHVAYVLADIDDFKLVNDRYGHKAGDEVLRQVARVFAESVRELDLAARYGGEEFALVLPGTQVPGARRIVERIRSAIAELEVRTSDGTPLTITASFGIAVFPTFGSADALLDAADSALYTAKRNGKNRVVAETKRGRPVAAPVAAAT